MQAEVIRPRKRLKAKDPGVKLMPVLSMFKKTFSLFAANKRIFFGLVVAYFILQVIFSQGLGNGQFGGLSDRLKHNNSSQVINNFGNVVGNSGSSGSSSGTTMQVFLFILVSLAAIWVLRQIFGGNSVTSVKKTFYESTGQLVPFILILALILLQLLPLLISSALFSIAYTAGIISNGFEFFVWALIFVLASWWSLYMLCASLIALYAVTVPGAAPMAALRGAQKLVKYRRHRVMLRLVLYPIVAVIILAAIVIPVIIIWSAAATAVTLVINSSLLILAHIYFYHLYQDLLQHEPAS